MEWMERKQGKIKISKARVISELQIYFWMQRACMGSTLYGVRRTPEACT